jgi:mono/diheme cytochrome c family protein
MFAGIRPTLLFLLLAAVMLTGCEPPVARYRLNMAFKRKQERLNLTVREGETEKVGEISREQTADVANILTALFGTPDDPRLPPAGKTEDDVEVDPSRIINLPLLKLAAGPVGSDELGRAHGLYREHCVHCHGVTGDGAGPTAAFLNPYPRDYRKGLYKFKSTKKGAKPTHEDLKRVLLDGVAGTAMPSFKLLPDQEVEALVHYVRYLTARGEVERRLFMLAATDLAPESPEEEPARLIQPATLESNNPAQLKTELEAYVGFALEAIGSWESAEAVPVPSPKVRDAQGDLVEASPGSVVELNPRDAASIARGRELYYGPIANCYSCHGESGLGDGQKDFYDDWSGEWVFKKEEDPHGDKLQELVDMGVLTPRNLIPRNLRQGVYRGGRRPIDLYWRIVNGIDGAQMPAAPMKADDAPPEQKGLTSQDVWDLVNYVRSMPNEAISRPALPESQLLKERL